MYPSGKLTSFGKGTDGTIGVSCFGQIGSVLFIVSVFRAHASDLSEGGRQNVHFWLTFIQKVALGPGNYLCHRTGITCWSPHRESNCRRRETVKTTG